MHPQESERHFPVLNFPQYAFRLKRDNSKPLVWDDIRKKWLVLTPEEWVRQHLIAYLQQELGIAKGRIGIETGLTINSLQKRSDIVVHDENAQPFILVECKAPSVKITQTTFEQISTYNIELKAPFLIVSNGLQHIAAQIDFETKSYCFLEWESLARSFKA